jgi:hypothetical protein
MPESASSVARRLSMSIQLSRDQLLDLLDRWRDDGDAAVRDRILTEFARLDDTVQLLTDILIEVAKG